MSITFPHIGPVYLIIALAMKELGIPTVIPPANTDETLQLGKKVSPEEMCIPFKYMAGNLIQAFELGARCVIMPATMGPCRLGEYGELLKQVLNQNGYPMEWILLDTPKAIGPRQWIKRLALASKERVVSIPKALYILERTMQLMARLDRLEAQIKGKAGYLKEPAQCVHLLRSLHKDLEDVQTIRNGNLVIKAYEQKLLRLPVERDKQVVRVLVTGEIYTSIEPSANHNAEEKLMQMGCSVRRPVTISWWMKHSVKGIVPKLRRTQAKYLPYNIGGYAKETVEEIYSAKEDGIIKLMPAGCMPEIVAKSVSHVIEEEKGSKVLHLIFDEVQTNTGYETRIEAFVDMLERRKCVLSGS